MKRRATKHADDKAQIAALLDAYTAAIRAKDARATVALYGRDVVAYDLAPPLQIKAKAVRDPNYIQQWFDSWKGPIRSTAKDLEIVVGKDVGYAFALRHMTGTKTMASVSTFGSGPPPASGARAERGRSRTCTIRCPLRWTAATALSSASNPDGLTEPSPPLGPGLR